MFIVYMLGWWYGKGWAWAFDRIGSQIANVGKTFAVSILLKTWFAPWKQITTVATSQTFIQKLVDNTISRAIGFVMRTFILLFALFWAGFITLLGILMVIVWPLLPISVILLPILFFMEISF